MTDSFNPAANRMALDDLLDGRTLSTYDAGNRLLTADALSGITTDSDDAAGNRTQVEEPSGDLITNTMDAQNHLAQVELSAGLSAVEARNPKGEIRRKQQISSRKRGMNRKSSAADGEGQFHKMVR